MIWFDAIIENTGKIPGIYLVRPRRRDFADVGWVTHYPTVNLRSDTSSPRPRANRPQIEGKLAVWGVPRIMYVDTLFGGFWVLLITEREKEKVSKTMASLNRSRYTWVYATMRNRLGSKFEGFLLSQW